MLTYYFLIFFIFALKTDGYPFFSPDGDITDKEKVGEFDNLARESQNSIDSLKKLDLKEDEQVIITPTNFNLPTNEDDKESNENKKKEKKKIYEEEVSIEELSSEIPNQNESPRKDKNQVKTDLETAKQEEKLKKLDMSKHEPITTSEEPSISTDMPKVDTELETANKTVEDLTKLIEPAPNTKPGEVNVDIVEKEEKFEPEISETSTDLVSLNEIHLNSTHLVKKPEQEIDIIPHIFMTEEPPTTTMQPIKLEHTTTIPITETSKIGKPEIITKSTISLPSTTTTSLPSTSSSQPPLPPVHIHQNELGKVGFGKIGGDETENKETEIDNPKQEMTLWEKYLMGLRCSMRDCKDALLPTEPFPRELSPPTVMRRIRGHEGTICACGSTHMNQAGNS